MAAHIGSIDLGRDYTIDETCEILGICRNTLRSYTRKHKIAAKVRKADGRQLYNGRDIHHLATTTI